MTFDPGQIISHTPPSQSVVSNANGTPSPVIGEGSLSLSDSLTLDSVLIVPSLHHNLLSVAQITTALNCTVTFWPTHCVFQDILSSKTIGCGTRRGKLYYLDLASDSEASLSQAYKIGGTSVEKKTSEVWLWHRRLGHASFGYLQKLFPSLFSGLESSSFKCDICDLAKSHRVPFPLSSNKSLIHFSLVHSDVWGPSKITTPGGARWFVTFIDDCTRMTWVSLLKTKGEVSSKFQQFYHMVETQFHTRIQVLRSDNGGEFLNHDLNEFFQAHGIIHQRSCPSTPQQNGVAERKNRHLLEVVRASLFGAHMPRSFWGEAVLSAAYLINRIPSIFAESVPLQSDPSHHTQEERIEEVMPAPENSSAPVPHQSSAEDVIQIPKRANRGKPPVHYEADINAKGKYPINNYVSLTRLSESRVHFVKQLAEIPVPNSVTEALEDQKWKEAMNEEMRALQKNGTWELVPLPHGKKTVGCRWIYTVKLKADGSVERYKARLVAKGYTQRYGIDYQETFAPVAKIKTIRILLSLAANLDWPLHQFDVKNAFLHGDLEEEVYMDLPPGCNFTRDKGNQVCKLKKSLYGLKQSPRAWFGRFTKSMKFFGYTQSNADHTLFLKRDGKKLTALIVYVDDIVVTGNDTGEQLKLQKYLSQEFEMKDLGDLKYFLGIEVARSANGICLSQRKYVLDLLAETGLLGCKPADTPIEMNHKLCEGMDQEPTNKEQYQRLVGRLIYLAHTRPDIAYAMLIGLDPLLIDALLQATSPSWEEI
ncbi:unnamed protein product [Prunus brigantina]